MTYRRRASPDQLTLPFIDGTAANAKSLVDKLVALSPAAEAIGTALKSYIDNLAAIALFLLGKRVAHQERDAARKRTAYKKQQNDSLGDFFSEEKTSAEKTSAEKTRSDSDSDSLSYLLDDDDDDARARANGKNEGKIEPVVPYGDIAKRLAGDCEQIVRAAGKYPRIAWPESATGRAIEHFLKAGLRADVIVDGVRIGTDRAPGVIRTFDYFCVPGGTIEEVQARASAKPELSLGVMGMTGRGSTPPTPVAAGVIIRRGTPQVDAWEKHNGKPFLWGIRSVATVPTEWPPGYEPHRKEADRAKGAA
jgi:hypothetical protein